MGQGEVSRQKMFFLRKKMFGKNKFRNRFVRLKLMLKESYQTALFEWMAGEGGTSLIRYTLLTFKSSTFPRNFPFYYGMIYYFKIRSLP